MAVSGGIDLAGLGTKLPHQSGHSLIRLDVSNAFNLFRQKTMRKELYKAMRKSWLTIRRGHVVRLPTYGYSVDNRAGREEGGPPEHRHPMERRQPVLFCMSIPVA